MQTYEQEYLRSELAKVQKNIDNAISCMSTNQDGEEHPWDGEDIMSNAARDDDPHRSPPCGWCRVMLEDAYKELSDIIAQLMMVTQNES